MSGGLYQTLHFYDTVEQLNVDTSREKVEELMKKIGADPAAIPGGSKGTGHEHKLNNRGI